MAGRYPPALRRTVLKPSDEGCERRREARRSRAESRDRPRAATPVARHAAPRPIPDAGAFSCVGPVAGMRRIFVKPQSPETRSRLPATSAGLPGPLRQTSHGPRSRARDGRREQPCIYLTRMLGKPVRDAAGAADRQHQRPRHRHGRGLPARHLARIRRTRQDAVHAVVAQVRRRRSTTSGVAAQRRADRPALLLPAARRGPARPRPAEQADRRHAGHEGRARQRPQALRVAQPAAAARRRGGHARHPARHLARARERDRLGRASCSARAAQREPHRVELHGPARPRPVAGQAVGHAQAPRTSCTPPTSPTSSNSSPPSQRAAVFAAPRQRRRPPTRSPSWRTSCRPTSSTTSPTSARPTSSR